MAMFLDVWHEDLIFLWGPRTLFQSHLFTTRSSNHLLQKLVWLIEEEYCINVFILVLLLRVALDSYIAPALGLFNFMSQYMPIYILGYSARHCDEQEWSNKRLNKTFSYSNLLGFSTVSGKWRSSPPLSLSRKIKLFLIFLFKWD